MYVKYTYILFHILFLYDLSQDIEYSSLCYTVGRHCLSILYMSTSVNPLIPNSQSHLPHYPPSWQPQICSLCLWVYFCFIDKSICWLMWDLKKIFLLKYSWFTIFCQFLVYDVGFFFPFIFRATSAAYGDSQARGLTRATAAGLRHSHNNSGSEPHLWPAPHLTATPDPWPTERGHGLNPHPHEY